MFLKAMGGAIPKVIMTAEIVKRKVPGLHQVSLRILGLLLARCLLIFERF